MQLNENQKFQVMLAELQERYQASHKIRERSIQFTLWISGMAIGLGWLLISQANLMISQRFALTLLILPPEYRGTKIKWNDHFCTLCVWLVIVAVAVLILTWSPAHSDRQLNSQTKIEQMKKEGKSNG